MNTQQDRRWWFSVLYEAIFAEPMRVERFQTQEQAELYVAATGGFVLDPYTVSDLVYAYYLRLSERTE